MGRGLFRDGSVALLLLVVACSSSRTRDDESDAGAGADAAERDAGTADDGGVAETCIPFEPERPLRPLTRPQYVASYEALTGAPPPHELPGDELAALGHPALPPSAPLLEAYHRNAVAAGPLLAASSGCDGAPECLRERLATLLDEAFRRRPGDDERAFYLDSFDLTVDALGDATAAFEAAVSVVLQSVHFLYVVELGDPAGPGEPWPLRPEERSTRVSLAFAGTGISLSGGPLDDSSLRDRAAEWITGGAPGIARFHRRWLRTDGARASDETLETAFEAETEAFVRHVYADDPRLTTLLTAPYSFLDPVTAEAYGVETPVGGFGRAELDPAVFASLVTHGSWLAGRGFAARGTLVVREMRCQVLPAPPDDVPVDPVEPEPGESLRETYERLTADPACAGCHALFDGYGFALGGFDREGRYVGGADTSGEVPGLGSFDGAAEMAALLAADAQTRRCFVDRWATYVLEREIDEGVGHAAEGIPCELEPLMASFAADDDLAAMLAELAVHPAMHRRAARPTADDPGPPASTPSALEDEGAGLRFVQSEALELAPLLTRPEQQMLELHVEALRDLERRLSTP